MTSYRLESIRDANVLCAQARDKRRAYVLPTDLVDAERGRELFIASHSLHDVDAPSHGSKMRGKRYENVSRIIIIFNSNVSDRGEKYDAVSIYIYIC